MRPLWLSGGLLECTTAGAGGSAAGGGEVAAEVGRAAQPRRARHLVDRELAGLEQLPGVQHPLRGPRWAPLPTTLPYVPQLVLAEVQRLARPAELAGMTAVFQAVTYVGFTAPYLLSVLHAYASASALLLAMAALGAVTLVVTASQARR